MENHPKSFHAWIWGLGLLALFTILSLKYGAASGLSTDLIIQLRLPRTLLAIGVGAALAVSGGVLQAAFSNPLCEPYTLGMSSGSTLGAVIGASLGVQTYWSGMTGFGFVGAIVFLLILDLIGRRAHYHATTLLLSGVMLSFVGSSLVALWMAVADSNGIQGAMYWLLGDLSRARLGSAFSVLLGTASLLAVILGRASELDALLLGEETATSLGVEVPLLRRKLVILTSCLVALAVSSAGMIGFLGLIVPHFIRKWVGSIHSRQLPLTALWGGVALLIADLLSRTLIRSYEVPVGVITALVGAPVFVWILFRERSFASKSGAA